MFFPVIWSIIKANKQLCSYFMKYFILIFPKTTNINFGALLKHFQKEDKKDLNVGKSVEIIDFSA